MKHRIFQVAGLASLLALLGAGCAQSADFQTSQDEPRVCMFANAVDDFHVIDRNHVVLMDRRDETLLLGTLSAVCWDLPRAFGITLESRGLSVCEGGTATLQVMGERCHISHLEAVASVEAAIFLVEARAEAADSED